MKAFFGALVLGLMSGVVGIFAAVGLHEMAAAADNSNAIYRAATADTTRSSEFQSISVSTPAARVS